MRPNATNPGLHIVVALCVLVAVCLLCAGVGYVRITTVRVEPDFTKDDSMPADYDPHGFGFPKGEEGPFCDVDEKYQKRNRWFGKGEANPQ